MLKPTTKPKARTKADWQDDYPFVPSPGTIGSNHSLSSDAPERDIIDRLYDVVEEVTRKPLIRHTRKMGFY